MVLESDAEDADDGRSSAVQTAEFLSRLQPPKPAEIFRKHRRGVDRVNPSYPWRTFSIPQSIQEIPQFLKQISRISRILRYFARILPSNSFHESYRYLAQSRQIIWADPIAVRAAPRSTRQAIQPSDWPSLGNWKMTWPLARAVGVC